MKAIEVPTPHVPAFLAAAQHLGLVVVHHKSVTIPGIQVYKVQMPYSQHQLFMLGVVFARQVAIMQEPVTMF